MTIKRILAASTLALIALPASADVRWNEAAARSGFESLPDAQRSSAQGVMKQAGLYASGLDGKWGPATARGAIATAEFLEDNSYDRLDFDLHTPEAARRLFQFLLTNEGPAYLWGEGGECDGPGC